MGLCARICRSHVAYDAKRQARGLRDCDWRDAQRGRIAEETFRLAGISDWQKYIGTDPVYYRPAEVHHLMGDNAKAKAQLSWSPRVKFKELVNIMLEADCKKLGIKIT